MAEQFNGDFLRWLRGFYAVAECGSMSRAAEKLGLRQPAISHLVQSLEASLGVSLFHRRNRTVELTAEGKKLKEKAISVFELLKEIRAEVGSGPEEYRGEISISSTHSVAANILVQPLAKFHALHPLTWLTLNLSGESGPTLDLVNESKIDLGIIPRDNYPDTIEATPVFMSRLVLVSNRERKFARDEQGYLAAIQELAGAPFISFAASSILHGVVERELLEHGVKPTVIVEANNSDVILKYVEAGFGATILEDFTACNYSDRLDIYPLQGERVKRTYSLIMRRHKKLSPQAAACAKFLLQSLGEDQIMGYGQMA